MVLAIACNIDSINILGLYSNNPSLRAAVAARSDSAMADSTANLSKLKDEENKNEEHLKQFMESQEELDRLNSGVLPFGWSYFPFGPSSPKPWSRTSLGFQTDPCWKAWQIWGDCSQMLAAIFWGGTACLGEAVTISSIVSPFL